MSIKVERVKARADMNDEYGVSLWQEKKLTDYTREEARVLALELLNAAAEGDRVLREDRAARTAEGLVAGMLSPAQTVGAL